MNAACGAVWNGWEIVDSLGIGSYGAVYRIRRNIFGVWENAALKVINLPRNSHELEDLYSNGYSNESITMMLKNQLGEIHQEYLLMHNLKGHTNIVCCDDFQYIPQQGSIGWRIYIRMELLTPLLQYLGTSISQEQTIRLGMDMCNALQLCRKHHIIHRDIKPQNIMVSRDGDYKLGDFGVAKIAESTSGGTKTGTVPYMAPEVFFCRPYGHQADIYSLGIVLYWMLNERKTPFLPLGDQIPSVEQMRKASDRRLAGEPLPPPAHGSRELQRIVLKACAFDPNMRYTSASEMLADLKSLSLEDLKDTDSVVTPEGITAGRDTASPKSPMGWYPAGDL